MQDTIVAVATPPGRGGVGILRVSGPNVKPLIQKSVGMNLKPRIATYAAFFPSESSAIDHGLAIFFPNPHSFTGEDVVELQGHGGPVVLDMLLSELLKTGLVRMALPGEFTQRAFLNDKLDLVQAEAVADLINASSTQAARSAMQTLKGSFSEAVTALVEDLTHLRVYVEAAIDFPEEEIDFLSDGKVSDKLEAIRKDLNTMIDHAQQGSRLQEGMTLVIAGKPNAGKSSLLNRLAKQEKAIVTDIAGTTRDIVHVSILIEGFPVELVDTAGLRVSDDTVEKMGIERARQAIIEADHVLLIADGTEQPDFLALKAELIPSAAHSLPCTFVKNKIDCTATPPSLEYIDEHALVSVSALSGEGVDILEGHLAKCLGVDHLAEGQFIARRRHCDALERARDALDQGAAQLYDFRAGELLAEECRLAQEALSEITGAFRSDDLLGRIFGEFCIGK